MTRHLKLSKHARALRKIKKGKQYRIIGKVPSHDGGWMNGWNDEAGGMDAYIGKVGTVCSMDDAGVRFEEIPYGWPAHVLEPADKVHKKDIIAKGKAKVKL